MVVADPPTSGTRVAVLSPHERVRAYSGHPHRPASRDHDAFWRQPISSGG
jgi:hypothetical protein